MRPILTPVDRRQLPLMLADGLKATFADLCSAPMPEELTALLSRLEADQSAQVVHGHSAPEAKRVDRRGRRRAA